MIEELKDLHPAVACTYIIVGGAIIVVGGEQKLVVEKDDKLKVTSNTASSADSTISVLEITP
jgi:hypothetical protein